MKRIIKRHKSYISQKVSLHIQTRTDVFSGGRRMNWFVITAFTGTLKAECIGCVFSITMLCQLNSTPPQPFLKSVRKNMVCFEMKILKTNSTVESSGKYREG